MKKIISFIITVSISFLLFASCNSVKNETDNDIDNSIDDIKLNFTVENNDFLYTLDGTVKFAVADNGNLYYIKMDEIEKKVIILDLDGKKISEGKIDDYNGMINGIAVFDNVFYFSFSPFKYNTAEITDDTEIYGYSFDTETQEKIAEIKGFTDVKKIIPSDGRLYLIGRDSELSMSKKIIGEHNYNGEIVKSVDLKNGKTETVFTDDKMPVMIAETEIGGVMLYAYDENEGYYFRELNSNKKVINNNLRLSNNFQINGSFNFEMYGESYAVYVADKIMYLSPINDIGGEARDLANNLFSADNTFILKSGYFFINVKDGIRRVYVNDLLKTSTILNLAFTNPNNPGFPAPDLQKLDFRVDSKMVEYYDFALSLLSNDSGYDLYYLNTWYDISDNIRRKGAFYPLNDVPFVKEYVDACFPYVKEAAYDDNGNIWMIPVYLQAEAIIYNELMCNEYGIEPESITSLEKLAETLSEIRVMDLKYQLGISHDTFFENYFYQLMQKNGGFNRDDFKKMAEFFYDNINYIKTEWDYNKYLGSGIAIDDYMLKKGSITTFDYRGRHFLNGVYVPQLKSLLSEALECEDYNEEDFWERIFKEMRFFGNDLNYINNHWILFPPVEGMTESDVILEFIAINPNSKNLDVVLDYVSKLCEYQLSLENSFILKDKSTYSDRHFINEVYDILNYEGNYIRFSLDSELIYNDFEKYLGDEVSLDEYLNNIEFKINAYLNE